MKRLLPILGFVCALVFACVREKPAPEGSDGDHPLSIRDARMFFDELKDDLRLGNRGNLPAGTRNEEDQQDPLAGIQPDWSKAQYSILLGKEVVEVPFEGLHVAVIIHTDSTQISESSAPPTQANSAVKLIAGLDDYGGIYYQILYISATWTYLEQFDKPASELTISDLDNGFSGIVKFYEIEGAFIGGIVVSSSEQVGTIRGNEQDSPILPAPQNAPITRAFNENSNCSVIIFQEWIWGWCDGSMTVGSEFENGDPGTNHTFQTLVPCMIQNNSSVTVCTKGGGGDVLGGLSGGGNSNGDNNGDNNDNDNEEEDEEEEPDSVITDNINVDSLLNAAKLDSLQREQVNDMLRKIRQTCMGRALYNALRGSGYEIVYDPNATNPTFNGTTITLNNLDAHSSFLHELFHALSLTGTNSLDHQIWGANHEAETHIATMFYILNYTYLTQGEDARDEEIIRRLNSTDIINTYVAVAGQLLDKNGNILTPSQIGESDELTFDWRPVWLWYTAF